MVRAADEAQPPQSAEIDYASPLECDVAIVGAELSGLVAGAILARRGRRVVVVDAPPQVGGRGGSTRHRGYWLDCGHRLGRDVTDLEIGWAWGQEACREADVSVRIRELDSHLRVYLLPELPPAGPAPTIDGAWSPEGFLGLARGVFGLPEALLPDFAKLLDRLAQASPAERRAAVEVPLGEWLPGTVPDPRLRRAVLLMAKTIYCQYPERASAGRIMGFLGLRDAARSLVTGFADDDEAGGMQGAIAPFARAISERGGRIVLDHEPAEVLFDGRRAAGVLALSPGHLALEIRAACTIVAWPIWSALPLLPPDRVDPELAGISRRLEDHSTAAIGLAIGLRRLPRLRATGEPETHRGWNRLFVGPEREFLGGFHLPSLSSRRAAPEGKHLLHCLITRWLRKDERIGWLESRATLAAARAYLSRFYADFDACVEWEARQLVERPAIMGWFWAPVSRHGVRAPGCDALYLANTTIESDAGPVDISAHAGLAAARAVLEDGTS
jgi:phytoene dehydrogenase-like protein